MQLEVAKTELIEAEFRLQRVQSAQKLNSAAEVSATRESVELAE